jgi:hypothetical protein
MKSRDIRPGKYAVKVDGQIIPAGVIRPVKNHPRRWVIVIDETVSDFGASVTDRTTDVTSHAIVAPWDEYSTDTAHEAAIHEDRMREHQADYDAKRAAFAERSEPFINTLRGISVPGEAFTSSNVDLPERDLGEWLHETFVEHGARGSSVTFDVFEAVAREILDLRARLIADAEGWEGETVDTGEPEVMIAETNTALVAVERLAAAAQAADQPEPPAGVSREGAAELEASQ